MDDASRYHPVSALITRTINNAYSEIKSVNAKMVRKNAGVDIFKDRRVNTATENPFRTVPNNKIVGYTTFTIKAAISHK